MELERVAIALRPRSGWESVDLGFGMARSWWKLCFGAFWITYLPIAAALLAGFHEQPWIALLILWWLKPAFDRFVLFALGRRCFGEQLRLSDLLGQWRQILSPSLLWSLTLGRLSPARSFLLAVTVLERQTGRAAGQRRSLLARRFYGNASGLTLVCVNLELVVQMGLSILFVILLQPGEDPFQQMMMTEGAFTEDWWGAEDTLWYILSVCLIEPLYVAGGFALYLNRRVILEGWDLELALKRLAARLPTAATLLLLLVLGLGAGSATSLQAAETPTDLELQLQPDPPYGERCQKQRDALAALLEGGELTEANSASKSASRSGVVEADPGLDSAQGTTAGESPVVTRARAVLARCEQFDLPPIETARRSSIVEILSDPEFGRVEQIERWRLREFDSDDDEDEPDDSASGISKFFELLASLWQVLVWVALAVLVLYIGRMLGRRWLGGGAVPDEGVVPTELFGLSITPDSLPDDIVGTALAWIDAGRLREALALVYRAALSQLVHQRGMRVAAGATEGDVLQTATPHLDTSAQRYMAALLKAWVEVAYAERSLPADQLRSLVREYPLHFEAPAEPPAEVAA